METAVAIKETGKPQRQDTELTEEIAHALIAKAISGQPLFTNKGAVGELELIMNDGTPLFLLRATLQGWIQRNNVIPGSGYVLRDLLDKARKEYGMRKIREMDEARQAKIDAKFNRAISIRTKEPVMGMFGPVINKETGRPYMRENVHLLSEQMKNIRYLAERLYPERYGKVEKSENKHLVFSLADLREAKRVRDAQKNGETSGEVR